MSIDSKLDIIGDSLTDIKGAIIAKGVTPEGNITTYANAIGEIGGGATLVNLTVSPSTTSQTITPASGTNGYGTVTVNAVTAAIDSDIQAGNIKSGINILGVTGNYSGITPTGTYSIIANGTYDITNYANVEVGVESQSEQGFLIQSNGSSNTGFVFKSVNIETISAYQWLFNKFYTFGNTISSVDFSGVVSISGDQALAYIFQLCTSIATVSFTDLGSLTGGGALYYAFNGCTGLKNIYFNSLKSNSFGSNTNQFNSMLVGVSGCKVHFPSNLQSTIGSWSDVTSGFGGTNTSVLYDLPATT